MQYSQCNATHAATLVCWLCSDKLPWWREARIKAGLGADPPNAHPNAVWTPARPPAPVCIECGCEITTRSQTGRCQSCYAARSVAVERARATRRVRQTPLGQRYTSVHGPTADAIDAAWEDHPEMSRTKVERLLRTGLLQAPVSA